MELKVIAYARNGHTDKFGIPRQSREESPIVTRIVFEPEYRIPEALRGIEGYSHLWLIWGFSRSFSSHTSSSTAWHEVLGDARSPQKLEWSPTVRPPRLGGNTRMGVFATRSPFRPNPIGLSSVKLIKVQRDNVQGTKGSSLELLVSGADVLDGTPIYDIKPYLSFSDSHEEATNGFAEAHKEDHLEVPLLRDLIYILSQDPRPGYQDDPEKEYKMDYAGYTITFRVEKANVLVEKIEKKGEIALF